MTSLVSTSFTPPASASASHISATGTNVASDLQVTLDAVNAKICNRENDPSARTIQKFVQANFEATRPAVKWWNLPARIRRARHERTHDKATLVLSMGAADGSTDGLYIGRRGLLFGSESSNFFKLTDRIPDRALKYAAGADHGTGFTNKLDAALDKLADRIDKGQPLPIREASFTPYVT